MFAYRDVIGQIFAKPIAKMFDTAKEMVSKEVKSPTVHSLGVAVNKGSIVRLI